MRTPPFRLAGFGFSRSTSVVRLPISMKQWLHIVDRLLYGKIALACALIGIVLVLFLILQPLPWRYFPDVGRFLSASWLSLLISSAIVYSGMATVAKRRGMPVDLVTCVMVGVIWKFTPAFAFLPFNFSRLLLVYGLSGLVAHAVRKSFSSAPASVASSPAPEAGSDLPAKPES